jgi:anti-sigma B factor antagonist
MQSKNLVAVELNDHFRQIFELTKLNEAIHVYNTEEEALQAGGLLS